MKFKLSTNLIVNIVVIGFALLIVANWSSFYFFSRKSHGQSGVDTNNFDYNHYRLIDTLKPVDAEIPQGAQLGYSTYKNLADSIKVVRELKNGDAGGSGVQFGCVGTTSSTYCDTCGKSWYMKQISPDANHERYYIKLFGWTIPQSNWGLTADEPDSVQFHVEHGQSYIRKNLKFSKLHLVRVADVPVKFCYNSRNNCLMIPVSKSTEKAITIILLVAICLAIAYMFYLIAGFFKFVFDLSKGLCFTDENLRRLKLIAFSLFIFPIFLLLVNFLLKLIFHSYFTSDVIFKSDIWSQSWKPILMGITFLALWNAFRQGKKLMDEQELTV